MGSIRRRGKKNKIELIFIYRNVRRFEPSQYYCEKNKPDCKCRSCKSASALVQEIERKISEGTFIYSQYFPKSSALKNMSLADVSEDIGFTTYAKQWYFLKEKALSYATQRTYWGFINRFADYFGNTPIKNIKASTVQGFIRDNDLKPKSISNMMGMLSSIFKQAVADDLITKNPVSYISKPKVQSKQIDPFDYDEMIKILKWVDAHHPEMTCFFAVAFFTGMRTGEIMALKWSDIDFNKHSITVQRTMSKGRLKESTKTSDSRTIDIIEDLDPYLARHKQYTFMKSDFMFLTYLNEPFCQIQNISKTYYEPCLKALQIKYRNIYQTRHSFACLMLDLKEDLNWLKNMLGHSTLEMILKTYGNRIIRKSTDRKRLNIQSG